MIKALDYTALKRFSIEKDLENLFIAADGDVIGMIGQEKAAKALDFGLAVKADGYNIYISGAAGTGKTTFAKAFAEKAAQKEPCPPELCYIYNFKNPQSPKLLKFAPGQAKLFREDIEEIISELVEDFPKVFSDSDFEDQKNEIVKTYQDKRELIIKDITEEAKKNSFGVKMTNSGIYFMPIVDGEIISEEQYDALSDEVKEDITSKSEIIQIKALDVMHQINAYEKATQKEVDNLEYKTGLFSLGRHLSRLFEKYEDNADVLDYLTCVKEDVLDSMSNFISEGSDEADSLQNILPWAGKKNKEDFLAKYMVNVLTENGEQTHAPVVVDYNPTVQNLVGEVEYDSEFGNFTTDYMKIKPGLLHKANGGYLILQVQDVISNAHVWETLKKVIRTKKVVIESTKEYATGITVTSIKPEPVDVDVKLILIGSSFYYELLSEYDEDFEKCFKYRVLFDYEMPYNEKNIMDFIAFVKNATRKQNLCPFDFGAVTALLAYAMRLAENQGKLSIRFGHLSDVMTEAAVWAKMDNEPMITAQYIQKAIKEKEKRVDLYAEKLGEMIDTDVIMIDTDGAKTAQINGLAVMETGDHIFSKPTRITATTYIGKAGVVNIEKEAAMSGSIHDKGIEVLTGYLGQKYAQEFPLSLSCRVCFEQNYSGIDGDSASSTELYAVLSSLSETPIRQDIAVTGSINQMGEIQAIGGVTYKIEGFFDLCNKRGLTGKQGVLIPEANVAELNLKDDVIEAVKAGVFHIYAIQTVDEGIEILTGIPAGTKNEKGKYDPGSIHGMVYKKLKDFHKKSIAL